MKRNAGLEFKAGQWRQAEREDIHRESTRETANTLARQPHARGPSPLPRSPNNGTTLIRMGGGPNGAPRCGSGGTTSLQIHSDIAVRSLLEVTVKNRAAVLPKLKLNRFEIEKKSITADACLSFRLRPKQN